VTQLIYRPEAVADIQAAFDWYERQRERLGDEFLEELRKTEETLKASPTAFRVIYRGTHRYLMHRFPYQVLYRVLNDVVVVVGCFHVRRSSRLVRERSDS
jgi:plasmid stabilization system protein ParE